jgi:hypothetical protein
MIYNYETLGDDRFQQFAQSLLTFAFPNVQCLPVNQPDGGRDAYYMVPNDGTGPDTKRIIFQVKYSREPSSKDARDVVEEAIKTERDKVGKLKRLGASAYYLITNVRGTAHLGSGSIDKANERLKEAFSLPSYCWWRDDLDARVNGHADVKWSFPEIMRGTDVLQLLMDRTAKENSEARSQALRSYVAAQHGDDLEVKFKQVELQNRLLDLFVDLPVARQSGLSRSLELQFERRGHLPVIDEGDYFIDQTGEAHWRRARPNAATFLLKTPLDSKVRKIVLEGAPGQGKSTITQYLCQVNRIRLLDIADELRQLSTDDRDSPVRVPFRIDLRDYASWVSGRNPFIVDTSTTPTPPSAVSLESFIAAQVTHLSGGHSFSVSDLTFIAKASHIVIVLDGFDEVADIETRRRVVEEITKATTRLYANTRSVQIIVTSRPAAFANSPGFPADDWVHLEIQSMTLEQITRYADKWMSARNLPLREKVEFNNLLGEKLEQPHMRDLSRNPMQLTILLALIQLRGLSLPDKRTTLYDSYMEHFFNREAEKSRIVRDHRDLLIDIHRYLAWVLHTAAETGAGTGSISEPNLKALLRTYLETKGHNVALVNSLFTGMVERVVALVSRVQGTFEFEVQPLREYFAARHLYQTAPYSPPGGERHGTKPERFDALSRNFYWLNVTRFFCGCFSSGELSSLADSLVELGRSEAYRLLSHPRRLSLMLLGDWVFNQEPLAARRVVQALFDQPGLKILLSNRVRAAFMIMLPEHCGREILEQKATELLKAPSSYEDRMALLEIARINASSDQVAATWQSRKPLSGGMSLWLWDGSRLGVFNTLPDTALFELVREYGKVALGPLLAADRYDIISSDANLHSEAIERLLNNTGVTNLRFSRREISSTYEHLRALLSPSTYRNALNYGRPGIRPFQFNAEYLQSNAISQDTTDANEAKTRKLIQEITKCFEEGEEDWSSSLAPWSHIVNVANTIFGPRWLFAMLAVIAAGIKSPSQKGEWQDGAWLGGPDLCRHLRYARLRSGNIAWWSQQIDKVLSSEGADLAALTLAIWGTTRTIVTLEDKISKLFDSLGDKQWRRVFRTAGDIAQRTAHGPKPFSPMEPIPSDRASPRLQLLLGQRGGPDYSVRMYGQGLRNYQGSDPAILSFCCDNALHLARRNESEWQDAISVIARSYGKGAALGGGPLEEKLMPIEIARTICTDAKKYPQRLVNAAEQRLSALTGSVAPKLGEVAAQNEWFSI